MVWNTIISNITCMSVWSITILARFITQTNSDDTNPPSYFWKQYIYNGDRRPWAQIDEISQTGWGPLLKIMRKFACVKLLLQLWCENPISNLGAISLKTLTLTRPRPSFLLLHEKYYLTQDWRPLVSVPLLWRHWSWISLQWRAQGGRDDRCCETF